nr:hypothetical protein [Tanacetum cinerariifolium]
LRQSKMSFHQALDLILELDEAAVGCTQGILRQRDCLDRLSKIPWLAIGRLVNGSSCNGIDMVIKDLDLEPKAAGGVPGASSGNDAPRVQSQATYVSKDGVSSDSATDFVLTMSAIQVVQNSLQKIMKNDDGFYFFKFDSKEGLEHVLERGPWMIRHIPLILTKWNPSISLNKEGITKVHVWVKTHKVPVVAYSEDGLSLIATQIRKPIMLDAFTMIMAIPNEKGNEYTKEVIRVEYEWKPPHCMDYKIFGHSYDTCPKNVNKSEPSVSSMDNQCDDFTKVKKKNKGSKDNKNPNSRNFGGFRSTKPKPNFYRPKRVPKPVQGKQVKSNSNLFNVLHSLGEEDSGEAPNPRVLRNIGKVMGSLSLLLVVVVETSKHGDDGGVNKHTSSSWNEDSESDDEVDEVIFPE